MGAGHSTLLQFWGTACLSPAASSNTALPAVHPAQGLLTFARHSLLYTLPLAFPQTGLRAAEQVQAFELAVVLAGLVVFVLAEPAPVLPPPGIAFGSAALQSVAHFVLEREPQAHRTSCLAHCSGWPGRRRG